MKHKKLSASRSSLLLFYLDCREKKTDPVGIDPDTQSEDDWKKRKNEEENVKNELSVHPTQFIF